MSTFKEEIDDLEVTIRQIEEEKANLIKHLERQDKNFSKVINDLKSVCNTKIEKLQLEIEQLKFALTKTEGEEPPLVYKLE